MSYNKMFGQEFTLTGTISPEDFIAIASPENREIKEIKLQDSGERRRFESGAVRDISKGKGRCDLLPLLEVAEIVDYEGDEGGILLDINNYIHTGQRTHIIKAVRTFAEKYFIEYGNGDGTEDDESDLKAARYTAILEAAKQYEDGCEKYGERNWEKGIPLHCYIDSGVRHYLKFLRGDDDEPHDRAFIWNMLGALWTQRNKPELVDLPFNDAQAEEKEKAAGR